MVFGAVLCDLGAAMSDAVQKKKKRVRKGEKWFLGQNMSLSCSFRDASYHIPASVIFEDLFNLFDLKRFFQPSPFCYFMTCEDLSNPFHVSVVFKVPSSPTHLLI